MIDEILKSTTIKSWAEDDRPREKMLLKGKHALSDAELIAIIIGSGTPKESAVDLCRRILASTDNSIAQLSRLSIKELTKFKGIGEAKAIGIAAALELGRRRREEEGIKRAKIQSAEDAVEIFQPLLGDLTHEEFWVLLLSRNNSIIGKHCVSKGGLTATVVDARTIFKLALEHTAASMILCHNHPSGNDKPSHEDLKLTKRLKQAGEMLDIAVLDHIIVTSHGFYSFANENQLS